MCRMLGGGWGRWLWIWLLGGRGGGGGRLAGGVLRRVGNGRSLVGELGRAWSWVGVGIVGLMGGFANLMRGLLVENGRIE